MPFWGVRQKFTPQNHKDVWEFFIVGQLLRQWKLLISWRIHCETRLFPQNSGCSGIAGLPLAHWHPEVGDPSVLISSLWDPVLPKECRDFKQNNDAVDLLISWVYTKQDFNNVGSIVIKLCLSNFLGQPSDWPFPKGLCSNIVWVSR